MSQLTLTAYVTNRGEDPLMNDLYELGLKHGMSFVVVARDLTTDTVRPLVIDHQDETPIREAAVQFAAAYLYLHDVVIAMCERIREEEKK